MKKRKAVKTAPSSKGSGAHTDIYIKEDDRVQEKIEGTATTVMEPSLEVTTINNAEPTHVDNHLETNTSAMERSAKLDNYVGYAEEPRNTTQELSEDAVRTVTDSAEDTTENNIETWPLSGSVPIVGTPKLETDVLFQNQRVTSNELSVPLEMDTVIVKKEAGLDAEEGSDTDEGAILNNDDSDWEPSIKKQRKGSVSGSDSSMTVSADQAQSKWFS